jgi:GNAT superfamily N-acetyltransferase
MSSAGGTGATLAFRRARAGDAATLTRIAHLAKRHWGYSETFMALWRADLTVTESVIDEDHVYCAVLDDTIIGFCAVSGDGSTRELEHMWVVPAHMGTGVGRKLLQCVLERLRHDGVATLQIASDPHAEEFYIKMGARRVGSVPSVPAGRTIPLLELALG